MAPPKKTATKSDFSFLKDFFEPMEWQQEVLQSDARFKVIRAGRRSGKTMMCSHEIVKRAINKPGMYWWVGQSRTGIRRGYRFVLQQLPQAALAKAPPSDQANEYIIHLKNGSIIEFYTANSPDSMAGEGVDFVIVDEAAMIPEFVWSQIVRPTLSDKQGHAMIISTPRGKNWFYQVDKLGQDPLNNEWQSWHFSSSVNTKLMTKEELESARRENPDMIFRQEYLAEYVDNAASIFRFGDEAISHLHEPRGHIVMGIDLAKKQDWTVLTAARLEDRRPVYHDRFTDISWVAQREMIIEAIRELEDEPKVTGVTCIVDSGGPGDVIFDDLDYHGIDVIPVNFSAGRKQAMVMQLARDLEHGDAFILPEQVNEFTSYEYEITASGNYKFEGSGGHDDEVAAKMLENYGCVHEAEPGVHVLEPIDEWADEKGPAQKELALSADSPLEIMNRSSAWV